MSTTTTSTSPRPAVTEVSAADASRLLQSGDAILIDVREPSENTAERIPGSRLVPLSRFDPAQVPAPEGKTVVLHCKAGRRSMDAAGRLAAAGRTNLASLTGGIDAWKAAGLPTEAPPPGAARPRMDVMRQTQITIGTLVLAGVVLGVLVSPWFLILSAFMGAGLVFAGASGSCGMAMAMARMPWNRA